MRVHRWQASGSYCGRRRQQARLYNAVSMLSPVATDWQAGVLAPASLRIAGLQVGLPRKAMASDRTAKSLCMHSYEYNR
jgi:hypothetical protein